MQIKRLLAYVFKIYCEVVGKEKISKQHAPSFLHLMTELLSFQPLPTELYSNTGFFGEPPQQASAASKRRQVSFPTINQPSPPPPLPSSFLSAREQSAINDLNNLDYQSIRTVLDNVDESVRNTIANMMEEQRKRAIAEKRRATLEARQQEEKQTARQSRLEEQERARTTRERRTHRTSTRQTQEENILDNWLETLRVSKWLFPRAGVDTSLVSRTRIPWDLFAAAFMLEWNDKTRATPEREFKSIDDALHAIEALRVTGLLQNIVGVYPWHPNYFFQTPYNALFTYEPSVLSQNLFVSAEMSQPMWLAVAENFSLHGLYLYEAAALA